MGAKTREATKREERIVFFMDIGSPAREKKVMLEHMTEMDRECNEQVMFIKLSF
jgi:dihydroxyacetone kinase DhaKLM complex PTS-EIIA-like component DhaM